jgi:hypothetical protein
MHLEKIATVSTARGQAPQYAKRFSTRVLAHRIPYIFPYLLVQDNSADENSPSDVVAKAMAFADGTSFAMMVDCIAQVRYFARSVVATYACSRF